MEYSRKTCASFVCPSKRMVCGIVMVACVWLHSFQLARARVADTIRDSKPPVETPLLKSLMGCRVSGVSPTWADFSIDLDADEAVPTIAWLSDPALGMPLKIGEGLYALFTSDGKSGVNLWHLDVKHQKITHKVHVDAGVDGTVGFQGWHWHQVGEQNLREILSVSISENSKFVGEKKFVRFDGKSLTTTIDLLTTKVDQKPELAKSLPTKERCLEKLSSQLLAAKTRRDEPGIEAAKAGVAEELAHAGSEFDYERGRFHLSRATVDNLRRIVTDLSLESDRIAEIRRVRDENVGRLPTCPALRDLSWQLQLAEAVASEDLDMLDKLSQGLKAVDLAADRASSLRNLAGYQRVHFIAAGVKGREGDRLEDYHQFVISAPKSLAARDAAILRIHEIAFRNACEIATVEAFDEFVTSFPSATQVADALDHAYDLEKERISDEARTGADVEGIANRLYVRWREDERSGRFLLANRSFRLLSEHPEVMKTSRAVDAQDTRDNLDFRKQMIGLQREHNETLSKVARIQRNQLAVMGEQLTAQQAMASQLGTIGGQLQYINENVRGLGYEQTRTRQAVEDLIGR